MFFRLHRGPSPPTAGCARGGLTDVAHLDLVADDGRVVEPGRRLPGEQDVGVGHRLDGRRVGRVGDVAEHHSARGLALAEGVARDHLRRRIKEEGQVERCEGRTPSPIVDS